MNILYTLSGFGFGHATRSRVVIKLLEKAGHSVKIATYGQSLAYFQKYLSSDIIEIAGLKSSLSGNEISKGKMFLDFLKKLPALAGKNLPLFRKIIKNFKIDVIFNDFEPTARWVARTMNVPLITIDNQFLSQLCKIEVSSQFTKDFAAFNSLISLFFPWGDWRFVLSFAPEFTPLKKHLAHNTFIIPPILREEIFEIKPQKKDFILVYQTAPVYKKELFQTLPKIKEKFICYNLGEPQIFKNMVLKGFSEKGILTDISRAKAVILNGGFTVMSEALYLKKPVFSLPFKGDFEQILNGLVVKKSGYGDFSQDFDENALKNFINNLDGFEKKLENYHQARNSIFEKKLRRVLRKIEFGE